MKRGEIYYIESTYRETGSEQRGGRPAVIVSNDKNNENSEVVEVVYHQTKKRPSNSCIYPERTLPFYRLMRTGKQRKREKDRDADRKIDKERARSRGLCSGNLSGDRLHGSAAKEAEHLLEEISKQPLRIVQQDPDVEKIKLETERDLYRNLYNELLSKTMKGASA